MIKNKKILSVITARAGSKGIKNKNIKELMGKPLFMWSVLASLNSKYIDRTVVSSNCDKVHKILSEFVEPKINKMASLPFRERYGNPEIGPIPFFIQRPDEISGDLSINEEALIHAVKFYKDRDNAEFDIVLNLQPTSPCRIGELLDKSIFEYSEGGYNSLLTAISETPFFWQKINNNWEYIDRYFCLEYVKKLYQEKKQWQLVKFFDNCCPP